MKTTGIVRRIDELGRIVIPKEVRKTLKINEGEELEIYIDNLENIVIKKYSNIKNIKEFVKKYIQSLNILIQGNIIVTDTKEIIAVKGHLKKEVINKEISDDLYSIILNKKNILSEEEIFITKNVSVNSSYKINIISSLGDVRGLIIYITEEEKITDLESKIIDMTSNFLSKYLEE